jgi:hypothetical protein
MSQETLLAPHMGHLNFSLKKAPSRPLTKQKNTKRTRPNRFVSGSENFGENIGSSTFAQQKS